LEKKSNEDIFAQHSKQAERKMKIAAAVFFVIILLAVYAQFQD
jgi:hypothetical protein